jgi:hypothetical protein
MEFLGVGELREAACGCLYEVVNKGMDDVARLRLIASLRIVDVVKTLKLNFAVDADVGASIRAAASQRLLRSIVVTWCDSFVGGIAAR